MNALNNPNVRPPLIFGLEQEIGPVIGPIRLDVDGQAAIREGVIVGARAAEEQTGTRSLLETAMEGCHAVAPDQESARNADLREFAAVAALLRARDKAREDLI